MGRPPGSRNTRSTETRQADTRQSDQREMPSSAHVGRLYVDPREIPDGFTYGWVRIASFNEPDDDHWDMKSSEGWSPVPRSRHPKFARGSLLPGRTSDPYSDVIVRGGLLLCEKPTPEVQAQKDAFHAIAQQRFQKISEWRGGEGVDPMMPRFDNSSPAQFSSPAFKKD